MKSSRQEGGTTQGAEVHNPTAKLTLDAIPEHFLEWLVSSRVKFLNEMIEGKPMRYFSAHLPVMSTWNHESPFPVNMTVKGIGLIPRAGLLQDYIDIFESVVAESRTMPWGESLGKRVEAMRRLYSAAGNFDPAMLGGLEIFEGSAFKNLRENPYASFLYVGMSSNPAGPKSVSPQNPVAIQYVSFQVNGKVDILGKDNPHYRFLLASRKLFEFDRFHLYQPDYPFGYLIRVMEVRDKSPWPKGRKA